MCGTRAAPDLCHLAARHRVRWHDAAMPLAKGNQAQGLAEQCWQSGAWARSVSVGQSQVRRQRPSDPNESRRRSHTSQSDDVMNGASSGISVTLGHPGSAARVDLIWSPAGVLQSPMKAPSSSRPAGVVGMNAVRFSERMRMAFH